MKKTILSLGAAVLVFAISCSKDDASSSSCCTVSVTLQGQTLSSKYCKVDANTVSVSVNGAAATNLTGTMLGGVSADTYMSNLKAAGCK